MSVRTYGLWLALIQTASTYAAGKVVTPPNPHASDFSCARGLERLNLKRMAQSFEFPPSFQSAEPSPFPALDAAKFPSVFQLQRFGTEKIENNIEVYYLTGAQLFQQGSPKNGYLVVTPEGVSFFEQADTYSREELEAFRDPRAPWRKVKDLHFPMRKDLKLALPNGKAIYLQHQQLLRRHPLTYGVVPGSWKQPSERAQIDGQGSFASEMPPLMTEKKWADVKATANVDFSSVRPFLVDNLSRELYGIAMQLREHSDKVPYELKHAYRALFDTHCKDFVAKNFPFLQNTKKGSIAYAFARASELTRAFPPRPPIQEKPLMPANPARPTLSPEPVVLAATEKKTKTPAIEKENSEAPDILPHVAAMAAPALAAPKGDAVRDFITGLKEQIAPLPQFTGNDFPRALECLRGIESFHDALPPELKNQRQLTGLYPVGGDRSLHYRVKNLAPGHFVIPTVKPSAGYYVYRSTPQGSAQAYFFAEQEAVDDTARDLKVYASAKSGAFELKRERGYLFDNGQRKFPFSARFVDDRDFGEITLAGIEDLPAAQAHISDDENAWKPFSDFVHDRLHALASHADHLIEDKSSKTVSEKRALQLKAVAAVCEAVPALKYTAMALVQAPAVQRYMEFDSQEPRPVPEPSLPHIAAMPKASTEPVVTKETFTDINGVKRQRLRVPVKQ